MKAVHDPGVVALLTRPDKAGMLVEFKGDFGLEGQAGAFQNDFWGEPVP